MKAAVLLIDCDLGLVFSLGRALDQSGYESFPAKSIPDSLSLITELHLSVDLVLVNCALPGAPDFIAGLRRKQPSVKIVALVQDVNGPVDPLVDWQIAKPPIVDETSKMHLLEVIQRALTPEVSYHQGEFLAAARGQRF